MDLFLTPVGFGALAAGDPWKSGWGSQDDNASIAAIQRALELGVNWTDTAAIYGLGHSEEVVAGALDAIASPRCRKMPGGGRTRNSRIRNSRTIPRSSSGRALWQSGTDAARAKRRSRGHSVGQR